MPSADLWAQFPVIGIILLFLIAIGLGLRSIFHEITAWQNAQDKKRDDERTKQREWENARDRVWQLFFEQLNQQNSKAISGNSEALEQLIGVTQQLINKFDMIYSKLIDHDKQAAEGFERLSSSNRKRGAS